MDVQDFKVDDIHQSYRDLQKMGVEFVAPGQIEGDGKRVTMFCFKDPDGTFLQACRLPTALPSAPSPIVGFSYTLSSSAAGEVSV